MKIVKRVIFVVILISTSIGLLVVGNGYDSYQEALKEMTLDKKVENVEKKNYYTKIEKVPKMYINAVISVEDHRFYRHNGIDIIAIRKSYY